MKGIILAGGTGSRLSPITQAVSKQLLPVFDKPMIYYPISTLIWAGITDILIITRPQDQTSFVSILGNGSQIGCNFQYATQDQPRGLADAFIIGEEFIGQDPVCLILGDNIFYGGGIINITRKCHNPIGGVVLACYVKDPQRYGVISFDAEQKPIKITEKPVHPDSNYAVSGLYFYNNSVIKIAKSITPSPRGELEISDINQAYLNQELLNVKVMNRETAWLDTGTFQSLLDATSFVSTIYQRNNLSIGCIEEAAYKNQLIDSNQLQKLAGQYSKSGYGEYLQSLI